MPNPGAFQGSRKEFLNGKKAEFARSVTFGYTADLLSTIQREYFKRYPIDLAHNEEPSAEHLAAVDDDTPDPDIEEPDAHEMDPEEYKAAMARIEERKALVAKRRAQIKRWFIYQYMKDHDGDPRDQRATSPYYAYLAKIRGQNRDRPRRKSAANIWRKFQRTRIDKLAKLAAERKGTPKSGMAALRDTIAREMFDALPPAEQSEWSTTAVDEHKLALEEWDRIRHGPVSTNPADRQMAIQNMVRFVQPVLDVIADSTGWKVSLFAGGPEPAQEGMLNVISVHSGTTMGDIKLSFGQAERASIKKDFIPSFGAFLRKCYSPEECRSRGLAEVEGFVPISEMEMEGGDAMVHNLDDPTSDTPTGPQSSVEITTTAPPPVIQPSQSSIAATATLSSDMSATASTLAAATVPSPLAQPVAVPAASSIQPSAVESDSTGDGPKDLDEDIEETPFPLFYRLPSESPPALGCFLSSPSGSLHSLPPSPIVGAHRSLPNAPVVAPPAPAVAASATVVAAPMVPSPAAVVVPSAPVVPSPAPVVVPSATVGDAPMLPPPAPAPIVVAPSAVISRTAPVVVPPEPIAIPSALAIPPSASATPSFAPGVSLDTPVRIRHSTKAHMQSTVRKENTKPQTDAEDRRPRREVKKTAKAISIEEDMLKKGFRGRKRACEVVEEASVAGPSKKARIGSRKGGLKG